MCVLRVSLKCVAHKLLFIICLVITYLKIRVNCGDLIPQNTKEEFCGRKVYLLTGVTVLIITHAINMSD